MPSVCLLPAIHAGHGSRSPQADPISEITIPWPSSPLSPKQWTDRLEALAEQAEALVHRPSTLQDQARLAVQWLGLCWSGMSPETIAASTRASLLLGTNVVMAADPASQVLEVAERLDRIFEQAKADPAAAIATVHPPLLERPPDPAAPPPPPAPPQAPADWLSPAEVAELLEVSESTVKVWRNTGRFGDGWGKRGRSYAYSPEAVDALMEGLIPPALEELMDEIRSQAVSPVVPTVLGEECSS